MSTVRKKKAPKRKAAKRNPIKRKASKYGSGSATLKKRTEKTLLGIKNPPAKYHLEQLKNVQKYMRLAKSISNVDNLMGMADAHWESVNSELLDKLHAGVITTTERQYYKRAGSIYDRIKDELYPSKKAKLSSKNPRRHYPRKGQGRPPKNGWFKFTIRSKRNRISVKLARGTSEDAIASAKVLAMRNHKVIVDGPHSRKPTRKADPAIRD